LLRSDKRGVNLISDALPFGRLWYGEQNAIEIRFVWNCGSITLQTPTPNGVIPPIDQFALNNCREQFANSRIRLAFHDTNVRRRSLIVIIFEKYPICQTAMFFDVDRDRFFVASWQMIRHDEIDES
jgi:hypothetical protein